MNVNKIEQQNIMDGFSVNPRIDLQLVNFQLNIRSDSFYSMHQRTTFLYICAIILPGPNKVI